MATVAPATGVGTTVVFGTSGVAAKVMGIRISGPHRKDIDISDLSIAAGSGRTFIGSDLYDGGTITLDIQFPQTVKTIVQMMSLATESITITFGASGSTFVTSGFIMDYGVDAKPGELLTATITVKATGNQSGTA